MTLNALRFLCVLCASVVNHHPALLLIIIAL
jgi:hypothetical protein